MNLSGIATELNKMSHRDLSHLFHSFDKSFSGDGVQLKKSTAQVEISGLSGQSDRMVGFPDHSLERVANDYLKSDFECVFCSEPIDFSRSDQVAVTRCGHFNHSECLDTWLVNHQECPQCRGALIEPRRYFLLKELLESLRFQFELSCQQSPHGSYQPRLVAVERPTVWSWLDDHGHPKAFGIETSSQIQQATETGLATVILVMIGSTPSFYLILPGAKSQIKVKLETDQQRHLVVKEGLYRAVNDEGDEFLLPEESQKSLKEAEQRDQRILVVWSEASRKLLKTSYRELAKMRTGDFQDRFGDLYLLHLGSRFQIRMSPEPDHHQRLKIRTLVPTD
jgi:hypothetical protein